VEQTLVELNDPIAPSKCVQTHKSAKILDSKKFEIAQDWQNDNELEPENLEIRPTSQNKDKGKQRKIESSSEEELPKDEGDTIMASPPHVSSPSGVTREAEDTVMASLPHHGSSCSIEGIIQEKAMENVFNFADNKPAPSAAFDLGSPVTGFVLVYNMLVDPTGLKPENLEPSTKVQVTINTNLAPILDSISKHFPAIKCECCNYLIIIILILIIISWYHLHL